uniref:Uncharacterized protein n=1 Tax=Oryza punctata TaxID=4537 RepID=A0A0E0M0F9_ORYPU
MGILFSCSVDDYDALEESAAALAPAAAESPKHEAAAVKLQKTRASGRRQLIDCAVLVEQSWLKLLDFTLLKRSSVSFFDIEKQETTVSRLGRDCPRMKKTQKLALQHWLEVIDPRHRYGHNLERIYSKKGISSSVSAREAAHLLVDDRGWATDRVRVQLPVGAVAASAGAGEPVAEERRLGVRVRVLLVLITVAAELQRRRCGEGV